VLRWIGCGECNLDGQELVRDLGSFVERSTDAFNSQTQPISVKTSLFGKHTGGESPSHRTSAHQENRILIPKETRQTIHESSRDNDDCYSSEKDSTLSSSAVAVGLGFTSIIFQS
jgi:hypothetical protein